MKLVRFKLIIALLIFIIPNKILAQAPPSRPNPITGDKSVCIGLSTALADTNGNGSGIWNSGNTSVATVTNGIVTGVSNGTSTISYSYVNTSFELINDMAIVTVNAMPDPGYMYYATAGVCQGSAITLNESVSGGVWSSANTSLAIVDGSGNVTGVSAGNTTIYYTVTNGACTAIAGATVYVNPLPVPGTISGNTSVCIGYTSSLTDLAYGGIWSSSNTSVAWVDASGNVNSVSVGSTTISYTIGNSCGTLAATALVIINPQPSPISIHAGYVCSQTSINLNDNSTGGIWSSGNTSIGTVNSYNGMVTGISAGIAPITYTLPGGCFATTIVSVDAIPYAGTINGTLNISEGGEVTLTDLAPGGTWHSCNNSIATVNNSGDVDGISDGSTVISYSVSNRCGAAYTIAKVIVGSCTHATNISTFAGDHVNGYTGDGGKATAADIGSSYGVAADAAGNVYISDYFNNVVRKVTPAGIITTIAGIAGGGGYNGDNILANTALLNGPMGVTVDGLGNLYIADKFNERIRMVNTAGTITTIAGNGLHGGWNVPGYGYGGPATAASLDYPVSIALDCSGNIYISDQGSETVRKIDPSGNIWNFAGNHAGGYNGDGIPATSAQLNEPSGITADCEGNVYIADAWNNRVRKVDASGIITTVAGNGTAGFYGDGQPGGSAELWIPSGVTLDACGDLYISDWQNNVVRVLNADGYITTFAGVHIDNFRGYAGDGGPADSAYLYLPSSVAIDGQGNIYIADYGNYVVRALGNALPPVRSFTNGTAQNMTVCANAVNTPINTQMAVNDETIGLTETWSVRINPAHGTLSGFSTTASSQHGTTMPKGLTYTPEAGYTGADAFTVVMNDGITSASTTVNLNVMPMPNAGAITGGTTITNNNNTTLVDATGDANGIWSSNNTLIATIDQDGNVTAIGNGIATINYTVTNTCGSNDASANIVIDNTATQISKAVLFPNPNSGSFQCSFTSETDCQLEMTVSDVTGRIVYTQVITATTGANTVNINLPQDIQRPSLLTVSLGNKHIKYNAVKITVTE